MCHFYYLFILYIWAVITLSLCVYGHLQNVIHLARFRLGFSLFSDTKHSPLFLLCSSSHAGHVFSSFIFLPCVLSHLLSLHLCSSRKGHTALRFFLFFRQSTASNAFPLHSLFVMTAIIIIKPVSPLLRIDFSYTLSWQRMKLQDYKYG